MTRRRRTALPWTRRELSAPGPRQTYSGDQLREIAFPLGGISTGTLSLGGCGELRDWEIFNQPNKNNPAGINFFALWAKAEGADPVVKVLETRPKAPYTGSHGYLYTRMMGLPRMQSLEFVGE